MIIKLQDLISISRQKEESIKRDLTFEDRVKGDRLVMAILISLTIMLAVVIA